MAYNAVPTVATGDPWTAANHNTYIRDNFAAGVPDIFTTAGDLAYATGANAAARLGIGSTDQVLTVESGLPAWKTIGLKTGKAYRSTNQSIANLTYTTVTFTTEESDNGGFIDLGTYNSRITIPSSGVHLLIGHVNFSDLNGTKMIRFYANGSGQLGEDLEINPTNFVSGSLIGIYSFSAGNYVELQAYQGSGGSINITYASLSVIKLS